ncbi:MAG: hypothetical protein LC667_20955, partial [Thioalkalivibrio sp.]|nr:hypothetical protein [Thioalkalivibrio sp.]
SITAPDGPTLTYTWDGFLPTGSSWSGTVAGTVAWGYDNEFRATSETVGSQAIAFTYDNDSLLKSAGSLQISRDPANGRVTGTTLGTTTDEYLFDAEGRLNTYVARQGTTEILRLAYERDAMGRITEKTEARYGVAFSEDYGYDVVGRLQTVHRNGLLVASYSYDANGNRLSKTNDAGVDVGTYDARDRMRTYAEATYTYTQNGELATKTDALGTTAYGYDALGNLRRVDLPDGTMIEYVIDGQNRRVGKKLNGVLQRAWLYADQLEPIAELDGAGNIVSRFVYATRPNVPDFMIRGGVIFRIVSDHLGSVRYVIDASTGTIAQSIQYDEFGVVTQEVNGEFQPFGFAGGIRDHHTGHVTLGAGTFSRQSCML